MPQVHPIKMNFTSGELSPRMLGRVDLDQYGAGVETMENFLPVIWGGARFRPGFRFVQEVKNSADQTRLIPFQFSREQAYALEFGDQYVRFYRDNGALIGFPIAVGNHSFETAGGGGADILASWVENVGDGSHTRQSSGGQRNDAYYRTVAGASANTYITQDITHGLSPGDDFTIKVYTRGDGTDAGRWRIEDVENVTDLLALTSTGVTSDTDWTQITFSGTVPVGNTSIRIYLQCPTVNTADAEFDNVQFFNDELPYEIATPFDEATIEQLAWTQSADILYIVHPDYGPQKLLRFGDDDWEIETIDFIGPNAVENANMDADAFWTKGSAWSIGLGVASISGAQAGNSDLTQSGVLEIGVTYDVKFTILNYSAGTMTPFCGTAAGTARSSNGTFTEQITCTGNTNFFVRANSTGNMDVDDIVVTSTIFDTEDNYPRAVCFFEERLFLAGTNNNPQTIWGSVSADYENFATGTLADDSVVYTIASDQVNVIEWITPSSSLFIGTAGGEFRAQGGGNNEIITPSSISIKSVSTNGAAGGVLPVRVGNVILFVQAAGKKVMEFKYNFQEDGYLGTNLSLISEHITGDGIKDMVWQKEPDSFIWAIREDGVLVSMTYERNNQVIAWASHTIGGADAEAKSLCVIPNPDGTKDELWAINSRTIDGGTVQYVEYMDDTVYGMDGWIGYVEGSPETDFTGAEHLEGETVTVLGDGAREPDVTVSGGGFTIELEATEVQVGLPYEGTLKTLIPNVQGNTGASFGFLQGWNTLRILVEGSLGGQINDQDLLLVDPGDLMGEAPDFYTGFLDIIETIWDENGQVTIQQPYPFPFNVLSLTGSLSIADVLGTGDNV